MVGSPVSPSGAQHVERAGSSQVIIDEGLVLEDSKRGKKRKPGAVVSDYAREEKKFELQDLMEPFQINHNPTYHPLITQALALAIQQQDELRAIGAMQCSFLTGSNATDAKSLANLSRTHQGFLSKISEVSRILRDLRRSQVLEVHDIQKMREIEAELSIQAQQIEVYNEELSVFQGFTQTPKCLLRLIIREQPFPYIYVRSSPPARNTAASAVPTVKTVEKDICLKLEVLTGSVVKILSVGSLEMEAKVGQKNTPCTDLKSFQMQIHNNITKCDAQFSFVSGTGMSVGNLEFRVNMHYSCAFPGGTVTNSDCLLANSGAFVVITNESQYAEALSVLFSSDITSTYPSTVAVPWPLIANGISRYFILASRQSMVCPPRPLLSSDLEYMRQQWFDSLHAVTHVNIKRFWKWFGVVLRNLRYQRHLQKLWERRLIYGFVRKYVTDGLLSTRDYGSFVLRFSESSPGCVAVCYKVPDIAKPVKNYIVKPEDIRGKTLPEYLISRHELTQIMQFISQGHDDSTPVVRCYDKLIALPQSRSKHVGSTAQTNAGGYETALF